MAQTDTGLGWSAESEYLRDLGNEVLGRIRSISSPDYPGQPLPVIGDLSTSAEIAAELSVHGVIVAIHNSDGSYLKAAASEDDVFLARYSPGSSAYDIFAVTSGTGKKIYMRRFSENGTVQSTPSVNWVISTYDSTSGLYYRADATANFTAWNYRPGVFGISPPEYATKADAIASLTTFSVSELYVSKLNAGYAAAAWVNWTDYAPSRVWTPVLISSNEAATKLSVDGTSESPYTVTLSYLRDGVRFFMTYLRRGMEGGLLSSVPLVDLADVPTSAKQVFDILAAGDHANILITATINPYGNTPSEELGGDGEDPVDDEVGLEPVVFPGAVSTGFCRIYCPSASELSALSDYLWSPLFDLDTVKRLFSDPMSSVLGLSVVPVSVSGTNSPVSIAGVSTGISLPKLSAQHINVDLGSLQVTEKWGAYLDYEPYTKYSVYLPFIGYRTISADDIMGKWVHLSYDIDLLSGACVAKLVSGSTLLYQWAGSCAMQLPVNAANWNSVISTGIAAIGSMATAIASGGAAAPVVAGALASAGTLATQMKPNIERAGGLSGAAAFLAGRRAYMIRTMPELINPGDQPHYIGYPSFVTKQLGTLTGYNIVEDIHLEGIPATQAELEEIDTLLHEGVIL